jgi:hypothetical protein
MSARIHPARRTALSLAVAAALAGAALLGAATPAAAADDGYFFGLVTPTPMVHLALPGSASEAQLIGTLQAQGFNDIKVTPLSPNAFDPRPELLHPDLTYSSPDDAAARNTPIHQGWNGTAVKSGRFYEVYVDSPAP